MFISSKSYAFYEIWWFEHGFIWFSKLTDDDETFSSSSERDVDLVDIGDES